MMKKSILGFGKFLQGFIVALALLFALIMPVLANGLNEVNGNNEGNDVLYMESSTPEHNENEENNGGENEKEEIPPPPPRWTNEMIADRSPTRRVNQIALRGYFPDVQPSFGAAYEGINARISVAATALIENAQRLRARTVAFSYEVHATREIVSVVMYANIAAVTPRITVKSINFCALTGETMSHEQVLGLNVAPLVERILTDWTRDNPERFYAAATAPLAAFYITDTQLVFLFDEFQLSTVAGNVGRVALTRSQIVPVRPIAPSEYLIRDDIYNLKVVPIGPIVRALDYYTFLDHDINTAFFWRDSTREHEMMRLTMGVNNYSWGDSRPRELEAPPVMYNFRVLIPITFFDQVMPRMVYHVDEAGYIHFLAYRGSHQP
ncbi:MAG: hypothetical protein FWC16_07315 [Defluviitaleaceae bacterium]|nr:hypothetical protein [Defluviitaleaceae bacterium]MCL2274722.1 hypothetical protein [Defluviitaleaceae bacterium]